MAEMAVKSHPLLKIKFSTRYEWLKIWLISPDRYVCKKFIKKLTDKVTENLKF